MEDSEAPTPARGGRTGAAPWTGAAPCNRASARGCPAPPLSDPYTTDLWGNSGIKDLGAPGHSLEMFQEFVSGVSLTSLGQT